MAGGFTACNLVSGRAIGAAACTWQSLSKISSISMAGSLLTSHIFLRPSWVKGWSGPLEDLTEATASHARARPCSAEGAEAEPRPERQALTQGIAPVAGLSGLPGVISS